MNRCTVCNEGNLRAQLVESWMYRQDGRWVLLRNVQANVCDICGERFFDQEAAGHISRVMDLNAGIVPHKFEYYAVFDMQRLDEHPRMLPGTNIPVVESAQFEVAEFPVQEPESTEQVLLQSVTTPV